MGTILRNAWTHIEALQTTDIPLLVEYVTGVRARVLTREGDRGRESRREEQKEREMEREIERLEVPVVAL